LSRQVSKQEVTLTGSVYYTDVVAGAETIRVVMK